LIEFREVYKSDAAKIGKEFRDICERKGKHLHPNVLTNILGNICIFNIARYTELFKATYYYKTISQITRNSFV